MRNFRTLKTLHLRLNILFAVTLICITAGAQDSLKQWNDYVKIQIDSLLEDDVFKTSQVGICIYDLTESSNIYSHNELQTMRPASTQKLITAITALDILGADHRMYTSVSYTGNIADRTLTGNIYCKGSSDPLFDDFCMLYIAQEIKCLGIDTIRGSVFLDKSMKDNSELGEGWCWDDENPPLSALTINGKDNFLFSMLEALEDEGIVLNVNAGFSTCPEDAIVICKTFHTLKEILPKMLKESDNFFAESMFYNLAASDNKKWASATDAAKKIKELAKELGHESSEFRVADGSGLSLYNYTTAQIEVDFLRHAYDDKDIFNTIYAALPIAGVDGTLKRRMKNDRYAMANVRAKTGSVSCVSSLAGYCKAANGHDIAFCIINQGMLRSKKARSFQDEVCSILCKPL